MRHLPIALLISLYVLVIGQNWAHYAAALMIYTSDCYDSPCNAILFRL